MSWYRRRKESYFLLSLLPWFWHSFCIPISFPSFSQTMHSFLQNSTQSFSRVCPQCHGYGQIFDPSHPCPRCNVFLHSKTSICIGKEDYWWTINYQIVCWRGNTFRVWTKSIWSISSHLFPIPNGGNDIPFYLPSKGAFVLNYALDKNISFDCSIECIISFIRSLFFSWWRSFYYSQCLWFSFLYIQ